jgi:hypothetical protein
MIVLTPITMISAHHHPPFWNRTHSRVSFAANPANGGRPIRLTRQQNIAAASTGDRRPSPRNAASCSDPLARHTCPATVNAPRFMNR